MNVNFTLSEESITAFVIITACYLALTTLVGLSSKSNSLRLIGLGLLTAIAAVAYAGLVPTTNETIPLMMKIAFLLVFAGVLLPFYASLDVKKNSSLDQKPVEGGSHD